MTVVAAVVRREGRVLVCQRPAHKRHGGLWEFPGGKVLEGETLGDALRRELEEELAIELVRIGRHLSRQQDPGAPFAIHFIEVDTRGQPERLEHEAVRWMEPGDVLGLPLAPGDRRFAEGWDERRSAAPRSPS